MNDPLLETFPLSNPLRRSVERALGLSFKRIDFDAKGPRGHCYWNVAATVAEQGGSTAYGWLILYWPGLYVEAIHHAVWVNPAGKLVDITKKYEGDHRNFSIFSPDDSIPVDLASPLYIPNKHYIIRDCEAVRDLLETSVKALDHKRETIGALISAGGRFQPGQGVALPRELRIAYQEQLTKMDSYDEEMSAAFDACARLR